MPSCPDAARAALPAARTRAPLQPAWGPRARVRACVQSMIRHGLSQATYNKKKQARMGRGMHTRAHAHHVAPSGCAARALAGDARPLLLRLSVACSSRLCGASVRGEGAGGHCSASIRHRARLREGDCCTPRTGPTNTGLIRRRQIRTPPLDPHQSIYQRQRGASPSLALASPPASALRAASREIVRSP